MSPRIVILTGSGLSAASGIPTFRDANGLWRNHRIEEVASPVAFRDHPALVHEFYDLRRRAALAAEPNAAHLALARLGQELGEGVLIVTQNVDDLHERAGSDGVRHLHGQLNQAWCTACGQRWPWAADLGDGPPCPGCGQPALRPDIVWFGENVYHLDEVLAAVAGCEMFVAIGTSGVVHPAAGLAAQARSGGARTLLLNLEDHDDPTPFEEVRLGPAVELVPAWVSEILAGG